MEVKRHEKRIVSFCLFGDDEVYTLGAVANAKLIDLVYPGWIGRFYVGDDVPAAIVEELRSMPRCEVEVFSRRDFPGRSAQILRFFPADEENVECVIVRDVDSRLNLREAAAVAEWLALDSRQVRFHLMHEAMHDDKYGPIMGGMWGARSTGIRRREDGTATTEIKGVENHESGSCLEPPVPGLIQAARAYLSKARPFKEAETQGEGYGDDMAFLATFLAPLVTEDNTVHHVDGDDRDTRRFETDTAAMRTQRRPYPATLYRGFVGQPVKCIGCSPAKFAAEGCPHVSRGIPGAVASQLKCDPKVLAALGGFLP